MSSRPQQSTGSLLLRCYSALENLDTSEWPRTLQREAAANDIAVHWRGLLSDEPSVAAVRVAHLIEIGGGGLHAWYSSWPSTAQAESAPLQFSAVAAGLLAGREGLQILAAAIDGSARDAGAIGGARVDGESCARMAVAGFDPETEIRLGNCLELLASAGDLVNRPAHVEGSSRTRGSIAPSRYLILGLNWHAPTGD